MRKQGESAHPERELKFLADPETFKAALKHSLFGQKIAGKPAPQAIKSLYFDTESGDLLQRGVTLRVRRMNRHMILGVKKEASPDGWFFERAEAETPSPSAEPDLSLLDKDIARKLEDIVGDKKLAPRFGSDVHRTLRTVKFRSAEIEVALDDGFLFAGERREPTHEIELELKTGEPAALFEFGLALLEALPLKLGVLSKARRGALMLSGEPPAPVHATSPALSPHMTIEEAIGALLRNALGHFLGNLPVLERGDPVEAVHQLRVGMRRLRSAFGLVYRFFPSAEFDALREESRRIETALGGARDWDVFVESLSEGALPSVIDAPGFETLIEAARVRAKRSHAAVMQPASARAAARFALSLERFVARRGWRIGAPDHRLERLSGPVAPFAVGSFDQLHRKLLKRGKGFDTLTPLERHAVRIAVKHLRYATQFFGSLFHPASAVELYTEKAVALQDLLGERNDATIALRLIHTLDFCSDAQFAYAAGVAAGWRARGGLGEEPALRKAWRSLRRAEPFWHGEAAVRKGE
jgi:inorganic triphosphatase YgiF